MFYVSARHIAKLKAQFALANPEDFDKGMWQLCRAVNQLPDIATSWCCSGHVEEGEKERDVFSVVMHTSTDKGLKTIAELYDWWCKFLGTEVVVDGVALPIHQTTELTISRLVDPLDEHEVVYAWTFSAEVHPGVNNSEKYLTALAKAVERLSFLGNRKTA